MQEFDLAWDAGLLVHAAALLQVFGFLNRGQLMLRCFVLAGNLLYIPFYYFHPEQPLLGAIFWSSVLATAGLIGIIRLLLDRRQRPGDRNDESFLNILKVLSPGEFRRLMQMAEWHTADRSVELTRQGEAVPSLYFVTGGQVEIEKDGRSFASGPGVFIGEVSFLIGGAATATVHARTGTEYIAWPRDALRKAIQRTPTLGASMERLFNQELARKVAVSWGH
ncbi:cyclic nucleotide-binding domain-containing protein [Pelagibius litoralis]|uniref:Cyclic nucleotide-binding domain-containing protein n=1 Tax=Pelagibius litoralis TaxID=374515 RepID=A0A967EXE3_9PROT|nr:cyclic nucleotide-binding domain-containing protein [Pelagibius litoralis]NIA69110.1 cyclic nucleotide-binding domain-containing protein [Pelagibius litoralis]